MPETRPDDWMLIRERTKRVAAAVAMVAGAVGADLRLAGESLSQLPEGVSAQQSVRTAHCEDRVAILLSAGGFTVPTEGHLSARTGSIALRCRTPQEWPVADDRALLHVGEEAHVHVTLLFRDGILTAVYKGGEAHFSALRTKVPRSWRPETWHEVQFSWRGAGEGEVDFLLVADGQLIGIAKGKRIAARPTTATVGVRGERIPWQGLLADVVLSVNPIVPAELAPGTRPITVRADQEVGECYRFWTIGNHNQPHRFTDAKYLARMTVSKIARTFCREQR